MSSDRRPFNDEHVKDATARKAYTITWARFLAPGETITAVAWTVEGPDAVLTIGTGAYAPTNTTQTATVWLLAGTAGVTYKVHCDVTLSTGQLDRRSLSIEVAHL